MDFDKIFSAAGIASPQRGTFGDTTPAEGVKIGAKWLGL